MVASQRIPEWELKIQAAKLSLNPSDIPSFMSGGGVQILVTKSEGETIHHFNKISSFKYTPFN